MSTLIRHCFQFITQTSLFFTSRISFSTQTSLFVNTQTSGALVNLALAVDRHGELDLNISNSAFDTWKALRLRVLAVNDPPSFAFAFDPITMTQSLPDSPETVHFPGFIVNVSKVRVV